MLLVRVGHGVRWGGGGGGGGGIKGGTGRAVKVFEKPCRIVGQGEGPVGGPTFPPASIVQGDNDDHCDCRTGASNTVSSPPPPPHLPGDLCHCLPQLYKAACRTGFCKMASRQLCRCCYISGRTKALHFQPHRKREVLGITGRAQELCESRGGRPGLPSLISLMISVDVKQHFNNHRPFMETTLNSRLTKAHVRQPRQVFDEYQSSVGAAYD